MAAVDPTEIPVTEDLEADAKPMATLKIVRFNDDSDSDEDDDDYEDIDDDDIDEEDSDEDMAELNGGPSDLKKTKLSKKQLLEALAADADEDEDMESEEDTDDEAEAQEVLARLQQSLKGKGKAEDDDEEADEDENDGESLEEDEHVICTLLPTSIPQQPIDITISEGERVYFKVIGSHTVSLTGNYVLPPLGDDEQDLEPDSDEELDELDGLDDLIAEGSDSEVDELDDLEDPRVTEVVEEEPVAPKAPKAEKGKNKRPAEDSDDEPALDDMISKSLKTDAAAAEPITNGETKKLTKAEKKKLKKLKNNEGAAADAPVADTNGTKDPKKVQFAKNLEQGPTPSPSTTATAKTSSPASDVKPAAAAGSSVRTVQGITIDDRKIGTGPAAKKNSTLSMRYIGKLESNGKVFDSNKSGKPFSFKLGSGEVIKGWDIGLEGMQNGGERRVTIPANLAYGKKGAPPDIPPNAVLRFDVKCVGVK